jgi:hypothetical protein
VRLGLVISAVSCSANATRYYLSTVIKRTVSEAYMIGDVEVSTGLKGAMHVRESILFFPYFS